jgi:hypothetical protein
MAHYTDQRKGFLVYEHGTAVFDDSPSGTDIITCNASLLEVVTHSPDFSVRPMRDGNFLVSFRGPVYGLVDGAFAKQNHQQLMSEALTQLPQFGPEDFFSSVGTGVGEQPAGLPHVKADVVPKTSG